MSHLDHEQVLGVDLRVRDLVAAMGKERSASCVKDGARFPAAGIVCEVPAILGIPGECADEVIPDALSTNILLRSHENALTEEGLVDLLAVGLRDQHLELRSTGCWLVMFDQGELIAVVGK